MIRASRVTLVGDNPEAHGVYDSPAHVTHEVDCMVQSVFQNEFYAALSQGLKPSCVLILSNYAEYSDEEYCIFEGSYYKIIRPYIRQDHRIELTIERVSNRDV